MTDIERYEDEALDMLEHAGNDDLDELDDLLESYDDDGDYEDAERRRRRRRGRSSRRSYGGSARRPRGYATRGELGRVAKVNARQSKEIAALRREFESQRQTQLIMTLLGGGKRTVKVESSKLGDLVNTELVLSDAGDPLTTLLPMLMSGGSLGGSSSGAKANDLTPLLLMMSLGGAK